MGVIYKVVNTVNNKVYIGQTARRFSVRQSEHLRQAQNRHRSCAYFHAAILKYGAENFKWEVVFETEDLQALDVKEIELIALYEAYGPKGYNLCEGGSSNRGYEHSEEVIEKRRNFRHSEESKEKMRQNNLGKIVSDATKEKLREANLGKTLSEETRAKISSSGKGKGTKRVVCLDTGEEFPSLTACAKSIGVAVGTLSGAIKNSQKTKGKYYEIRKTVQTEQE